MKYLVIAFVLYSPIPFTDYLNSLQTLNDQYPKMKESYYRVIDQETKKTVFENKEICALIYVESRFNEKAVSPSGAIGLTQIMPYHGTFNAEQSIVWTINHLQKECLKTANGNKYLSFAYYHGGNGRKFLRRIDQDYVFAILKRLT
jgi:soluble lytic murein transglycosylase-like protein